MNTRTANRPTAGPCARALQGNPEITSMLIEKYFSQNDNTLSFTREQGSAFAKSLAGDFNPLHDADAKRFCIPGDLLFAIVLARYGVSQHMEFVFSGMVVDGVELLLPPPADEFALLDAQGRDYLKVKRSGECSVAEALIQNLTRSYVEFSGHTFPHILQPLMEQQQVMIHPTRPMVIYQSMTIDLDRLDIAAPMLESDHNELVVDGKRGAARLGFQLTDSGEVVGRGCKRMLLSGLRPYDAQAMAAAVADFNARKAAYPGK